MARGEINAPCHFCIIKFIHLAKLQKRDEVFNSYVESLLPWVLFVPLYWVLIAAARPAAINTQYKGTKRTQGEEDSLAVKNLISFLQLRQMNKFDDAEMARSVYFSFCHVLFCHVRRLLLAAAAAAAAAADPTNCAKICGK